MARVFQMSRVGKMADLWPTAEDTPPKAVPDREAPVSSENLGRIVRQSLFRELQARRDRAPHAQLGVILGADQIAIRRSFERLRAQYGPQVFVAHGSEAVALAAEILELARAACYQLTVPESERGQVLTPLVPARRADETLRALETLRGSIARRKAQAQRLVAAGQLDDASRMFESVLQLDRHDEVARTQLCRLRQPNRGPVLAVVVARLEWLWAVFSRMWNRG